jgi:hypothetical protein
MAAARALGVIHVDRAARYRRERVLQKSGFVEGVGVDLHLKVERVGDFQAAIDGRGHRAPVLVNLEPEAAGLHLLDERSRLVRIAASEKAEIDRPMLGGLKHLADVERPAGIDADCYRPQRAADHRGDARGDGVLAKGGGIEMHVNVDAACGGDQPLAIAHGGRLRHDEAWVHPVHDRRIARLAEADNAAILDAEIALHDT